MAALSKKEYHRYSRHLNLPGFTIESQLQLKGSKVLVVGAGGLGSPLLQYLAAAGVGHIGIVDPDIVELSNLQRQVVYGQEDIGQSKAILAKNVLERLNENITVEAYETSLTADNALDIIQKYDIVADGTDNFPTRYLVNDACVLCEKPNVYASIYQFEGQVSVFNYLYEDGSRSPNYRDLFPQPPAHGLVPDCASGGVLGVLAGIVGSLQALEVIKVLCNIGSPLAGRLMIYDSLSGESQLIKFKKKSNIEITELINYEEFCGVNATLNNNSMKEITVTQLNEWKESDKDFQLIDVREKNEIDFVNIGGQHIPMGDIMDSKDRISQEKDVVMMCRSGQRSGVIVNALTQQGFDNVYNLKGGILAWAKEIDTSLPTY